MPQAGENSSLTAWPPVAGASKMHEGLMHKNGERILATPQERKSPLPKPGPFGEIGDLE
jgi:hypothetical protein